MFGWFHYLYRPPLPPKRWIPTGPPTYAVGAGTTSGLATAEATLAGTGALSGRGLGWATAVALVTATGALSATSSGHSRVSSRR